MPRAFLLQGKKRRAEEELPIPGSPEMERETQQERCQSCSPGAEGGCESSPSTRETRLPSSPSHLLMGRPSDRQIHTSPLTSPETDPSHKSRLHSMSSIFSKHSTRISSGHSAFTPVTPGSKKSPVEESLHVDTDLPPSMSSSHRLHILPDTHHRIPMHPAPAPPLGCVFPRHHHLQIPPPTMLQAYPDPRLPITNYYMTLARLHSQYLERSLSLAYLARDQRPHRSDRNVSTSSEEECGKDSPQSRESEVRERTSGLSSPLPPPARQVEVTVDEHSTPEKSPRGSHDQQDSSSETGSVPETHQHRSPLPLPGFPAMTSLPVGEHRTTPHASPQMWHHRDVIRLTGPPFQHIPSYAVAHSLPPPPPPPHPMGLARAHGLASGMEGMIPHPGLVPYSGGRPRDPSKPPALKKYKCDVCGKGFSRSNTLVTHKRIHTGEKPFACEVCGRAFRQPGNLTRHRLTHTTVKPYVCPHCHKAFNRASNLQTHMRTHNNFRPFVCVTCGQAFQQKIDLKIHSYTHSNR